MKCSVDTAKVTVSFGAPLKCKSMYLIVIKFTVIDFSGAI